MFILNTSVVVWTTLSWNSRSYQYTKATFTAQRVSLSNRDSIIIFLNNSTHSFRNYHCVYVVHITWGESYKTSMSNIQIPKIFPTIVSFWPIMFCNATIEHQYVPCILFIQLPATSLLLFILSSLLFCEDQNPTNCIACQNHTAEISLIRTIEHTPYQSLKQNMTSSLKKLGWNCEHQSHWLTLLSVENIKSKFPNRIIKN